MKAERGDDVVIMLVGNKTDLSDRRYGEVFLSQRSGKTAYLSLNLKNLAKFFTNFPFCLKQKTLL